MKPLSFKSASKIGDEGVRVVLNYLRSLSTTLEVQDVQESPVFQKKDVDLIWKREVVNREIEFTDWTTYYIEVKADTYSSGNFYIETVSNTTKMNPGCFFYTSADFIFYVFIDSLTYIIPMEKWREWWRANGQRFREVETCTTRGETKEVLYHSRGVLVPIKTMMSELKLRTFKTEDYKGQQHGSFRRGDRKPGIGKSVKVPGVDSKNQEQTNQ